MTLPIVSLSLLDPLYSLFGIIIRFIYSIFNNYGVSIILFTILIRGIMIPFSVKQHKSSLQQRALQPQLAELQRAYGNDKQGYSEAQMELYKKNNVSVFGGCLPSLLTLVLIWPVYRIISGPMHYIMQVSAENLTAIGNLLVGHGLLSEAAVNNITTMNIPVMQALHANPQVLAEVVDKGLMRVTDLMDLNFLGLNLGLTPTINPSLLFGEQMSTYLPLMILPILATGLTILQTWFSQKTLANTTKKTDEQKEAERKNPALAGQAEVPDAASQSMKSMTYMMPIMTLFFTFTMPAAMSLYWIIGSIMGIGQSWLLDTIYTKPMASRQAEADAKYEAEVLARVNSEKKALAEKEEQKTKKKRRRTSN